MRLLLDTHVYLWWLADSPMSAQASAAIADPDNDVWVSAASIWEIAIKGAAGRLTIDGDPIGLAEACGFLLLDIRPTHAAHAAGLPEHHRDPFDRMLIAQAQLEQLVLVTRDRRLQEYDVPLLAA